ncbi:nucleotidyltransferase domain-containing protein [uncultured Endozoicomonas sp.]|uniref:nucleotidyltransferase domain-containing protein n=1 Tax=uncultured Endozoicomonas sp. TaxID=432652 RepID=UPI002639D44A|nr:nucleotidyltransferase domain-containing protein [uncultured Endozoicomonas sp.]
MEFPSSLPTLHQKFIEQCLPKLANDTRIVGIAVSGSYADNSLDIYSDIDLLIAVEPEEFGAIMNDRLSIISNLGEMAAGFTGEHVGKPRSLTENSARSEDGRKLKMKILFCEVNIGAIC